MTDWITTGTGNWNDTANWSAGVPINSSTATIAVSGTAILGAGAGNYNTLILGNSSDGTLIVSGGALSGTMTSLGSLGTGNLTVSGGTLSTPTVNVFSTAVDTGSISLNGGVLSTTSITANNGGAVTALTFNGGTLQAGGNTASLISGFPGGSANIAGPATIDNNGFSVEIPQRISAGGVLTSTGTGILILSGSSYDVFSGSIVIPSGTLQFGNGTSGIGNMSNNMTNNAVIVYSCTDSINVFSTISGTGQLIKQGPNLITLAANNTYTGTTVINDGILRIGIGSAIGSVGGNVVVNGTSQLFLNRSGSSTFSGNISGPGTVRINPLATGQVTFTGSNTYTGVTTLNTGTLQIGNGGTTGFIVAPIANSKTVVFNHSDSITYSNIISGSGAVINAGTGPLILTGSNTYTGGTTLMQAARCS